MPSKKHKPEKIIGKLREVEIVLVRIPTMPAGYSDLIPATIPI
nr:hypothetical protein [Sphingomonas populi]